MFEKLTEAPPDAIFGLIEAYEGNERADKVSLCSGVYQDESGHTPIFRAVKAAEARLVETESSKDYLGITGSPEFCGHVVDLVFGLLPDLVASGRVVSVQTPGGTGALRIAADLLKKTLPTPPGVAQRADVGEPPEAIHRRGL